MKFKIPKFLRLIGEWRPLRKKLQPDSTGINLADFDCDVPLPKTLFGGQEWPKISIVTPSFNQALFIAETIESVIEQGYPKVELIIVDGGSTDGTLDVIDRYRKNIDIVISEPDNGQSHAINKGFHLATGEILSWLNSDDRLAPGALAAVAMAFVSQKVDIVTGICEIHRGGKLQDRHMSSCGNGVLPLDELLDLEKAWNAGQFFYQPEVFFSRDLWIKSGSHVREDCYYSMDYELWCRFALAGARIHVIGAPLAKYRVHPDQKTADPTKFNAELVVVRKQFMDNQSLSNAPSLRPRVRFERRLRIIMLNDLGKRYGAGIAHGRIGASFEMAGHEVSYIDLDSSRTEVGKVDETQIVKRVVQSKPDLVVFGNFHGATRDSIKVVQDISKTVTCIWVVHDFWLFTGRCAYPGDCKKYNSGCDAKCPTATQYPKLIPRKIAPAWRNKRAMLSGVNPPIIVGYSRWATDRAREMLSTLNNEALRVDKVRLGAPADFFRPLDKGKARQHFGIASEQFVIAFSVSSLSEERKGAKYLLQALKSINLPNITLIIIGYQDVQIEFNDVDVVSLGYVNEPAKLVLALNAADVYVGPSIDETLGQVFIEAALAGIPSIGFDRTGVRDAIVDGITGYLVPQSSESLRQAILKLYHDRLLCKSLGGWARLYACNEFSLESLYESFFVLWRRLGLADKWGIPHKISLR